MNGHARTTRRKTSRERSLRASGNANSAGAGGGTILGSASNRIHARSLAGRGAGRGQDVVFEGEFRGTRDSVLIAAERVAALEVGRHGGEGRVRSRSVELDGHRYRAVL